jgi:hypothetical protein
MKRAAVLAFALMFAACLFHFYYAEDHCPIHCPSRGGGFGHVHPHHHGAEVCLCFWSTLMGPETSDFLPSPAFAALLGSKTEACVLAMLAADITPPPRSSLV